MREQPPSQLYSIDLGIAEELRDEEFRNQFFRAEREIDIPYQLKALRKARDLNQAELAEKSGMKQSAVSRIENTNDGKFNLETLVRLAEAMDARLAVIIEPYEAVIARYRDEERRRGRSAATAQIENIPPANNVPDDPYTTFKQKPPTGHLEELEKRTSGASWK